MLVSACLFVWIRFIPKDEVFGVFKVAEIFLWFWEREVSNQCHFRWSSLKQSYDNSETDAHKSKMEVVAS